MELMHWQREGAVAVLTWDNGANKMNLDFAGQMLATLDEVLADREVKALVITSSDEKNWTQGIDLEWLMPVFQAGDLDTIKAFLRAMNQVFQRVLLFPLPVIAAINGHAFGNGAILACCCDFRFMLAEKGFFCFPEVDISIPFLPGQLAVMKKAIPYPQLQAMVYQGKRTTGPELVERQVVVKACADRDELMREAMAFAATFDKKRGIYGEIKKRMYKDIVQAQDNEDPPYIEAVSLRA